MLAIVRWILVTVTLLGFLTGCAGHLTVKLEVEGRFVTQPDLEGTP